MTTTTNSDYYVVRAGGCGHLVRLLKQPLPATGLAEMQAAGFCAGCHRDPNTGELVESTLAEFRADQARLAVEATQPEHAA